ncbi:hypothetical protein D3C72_1244130 [compost metagenome]
MKDVLCRIAIRQARQQIDEGLRRVRAVNDTANDIHKNLVTATQLRERAIYPDFIQCGDPLGYPAKRRCPPFSHAGRQDTTAQRGSIALPQPEQANHQGQQLGRIHRLRQGVTHSAVCRHGDVCFRQVRRNRHYRKIAHVRHASDLFGGFEAIQARHLKINQHNVDSGTPQNIQRFMPIAGHVHLGTCPDQDLPHDGAHDIVVLGQQNGMIDQAIPVDMAGLIRRAAFASSAAIGGSGARLGQQCRLEPHMHPLPRDEISCIPAIQRWAKHDEVHAATPKGCVKTVQERWRKAPPVDEDVFGSGDAPIVREQDGT